MPETPIDADQLFARTLAERDLAIAGLNRQLEAALAALGEKAATLERLEAELLVATRICLAHEAEARELGDRLETALAAAAAADLASRQAAVRLRDAEQSARQRLRPGIGTRARRLVSRMAALWHRMAVSRPERRP